MAFELPEEYRMLQDLVAKFVDRDLMPLEKAVIAREADGGKLALTDEEEAPLLAKCRELGLWGLEAPEELGGSDLPVIATMGIYEEMGRTVVPFIFPPDSPNLHMLAKVATPEQRKKYLEPYARGETRSAIAISEPNGGGDPAAMITRGVKDGNDWVINGRKIWISRAPQADFVILMARTGDGKRHEGITAFIIDKGTPGFHIEREIKMIGGRRTYEIVLDNLRVPESQVLGEPGQGFAPMQLRLTARRLQQGATCVGMARRCLDMMCEHAKQRSTFGMKLAERQAIQWWIADAATRIHACRLMVQDAAIKQGEGKDVRTEASMIKIFATETATEVIDKTMQIHGAMGMTKEMPLQIFMQWIRVQRIVEGPTEIHRMVVARRTLRDRK